MLSELSLKMETIESLTKLCRSCLKNIGSVHIFGDFKETKISEMMFLCTSITALPSEPYPQHLCSSCMCSLTDAFLFQKQCQKSERKIRLLYQAKLEVKNEAPELKYKIEEVNFDYDESFIESALEKHEDTKDAPKEINRTKPKEYIKLSLATISERMKAAKKAVEKVVKKKVCKKQSKSVAKRKTREKQTVKKDNLATTKSTDHDKEFSVLVMKKELIKEKQEQYICDLCNASTISRNGMILHMKAHFEARPFKCDVCNKSFKRPEHLERHGVFHGRMESICDICGKKFKFPHSLQAHRTIHTGEKRHKCSVCGQSFRTYQRMRTHRDKHGERIKNHVCEICGKKVFTKNSLARHRRTHTGERPEQCPLCPKAFSTKSILSTHIKFHLGQKDHQCPHCDKSFVTRGALKVHSCTHKTDRPYKCDTCFKEFSCLSSLKTHQHSHSLSNQFTCSICSHSFKYPSALSVHRRKVHDVGNQQEIQTDSSEEDNVKKEDK